MNKLIRIFNNLCVYGSTILLIGCGTLKLPPANLDTKRVNLNKDNYSILNGEYQIYSSDSSDVSLDYYLTLKGIFDFQNRPGPEDKVSITVLDERHLLVTVFKAGKVIVKQKMKVRLTYGDFMCTRKVLRPFYLALNVFHNQSMRIGFSPQGDLLIDNVHSRIGFLFFIPIPISCTQTQELDLMYRRIR